MDVRIDMRVFFQDLEGLTEILEARLGSWRNTDWNVLFQKRELTKFCDKLGERSAKNSVSSLWHTNNRVEGNSLSSLPGARSGLPNSLSSVFEAAPSETVFSPFPKDICLDNPPGYQRDIRPGCFFVPDLCV